MALVARREDALRRVAAEAPGARVYPHDVTRGDEVAIGARVVAEIGEPDLLVYAAGVMPRIRLEAVVRTICEVDENPRGRTPPSPGCRGADNGQAVAVRPRRRAVHLGSGAARGDERRDAGPPPRRRGSARTVRVGGYAGGSSLPPRRRRPRSGPGRRRVGLLLGPHQLTAIAQPLDETGDTGRRRSTPTAAPRQRPEGAPQRMSRGRHVGDGLEAPQASGPRGRSSPASILPRMT